MPQKEMNSFDNVLSRLSVDDHDCDENREMVDNIDYDESSSKSEEFDAESNDALYGYSESMTDVADTLSTFNKEEEPVPSIPIMQKETAKYTVLRSNTNTRNRPKASRFKVRSGYKYSGKGFEVFTGRNRCKAIFSATTLFCRETCSADADKLKNYLVKFGKFKHEMFEEIVFKQSANHRFYALVKVRASLKVIKQKMKKLNRAKGAPMMHIFERAKYVNKSLPAQCTNVLFVNNFDILRKDSHRKFTNLFLKYGELVMDIKMGLDKNRNTFAIVHFRDFEDAQKCVESRKPFVFDGKILNISYSKF
eukprot:TRINITY_DN289_c0_g1_i1.p1 TRINITY_DN289_c0_g1~~TRINITY_DN289_c0_g1_i1.p1  ORF type:complete len:307 (+),score=86.85 TRINITY_DN289_c0_g1_i1:179-1099(+)